MSFSDWFLPQGDTDYINKLNRLGESVNSAETYAANQVANVQAQAVLAQTYATQAAASAAGAASVVQQDLTAIDRTFLTSTALVDLCLYDTSKDSDGGAWRKRCAQTSWENETLSGNWLGSAASEAAARLISGATTGSYFYNTTAGAFYKLDAGSGTTIVYRGNARQFPAVALITAEASRVIIWDLTQANAPMWMVFGPGGLIDWPTTTHTRIYAAAVNGQLATVSEDGGVIFRFIDDTARIIYNSLTYNVTSSRAIANRQGTASYTTSGGAQYTYAIANAACNGVGIAVLSNAPVDVATGLPVPTIGVWTDAGYSQINHDGTVASDTAIHGRAKQGRGGFLRLDRAFGIAKTTESDAVLWIENLAVVPFAEGSNVRYPFFESGDLALSLLPIAASTTKSRTCAGRDEVIVGADGGVAVIHENPATPTQGMLAYITSAFNSGWLPGAIKGAWLSDTTVESLVGAELVTNGTDWTAASGATPPTGWTALLAATFGVASGELTITNAGATAGGITQGVATVVGKVYVATVTARIGTASPVNLKVGTTSGGAELGSASTTSGSNTALAVTFTATGTTTYLSVANDADSGGTGIYDTLTCRLAVPDRSVNTKGAQVFGSITKAAVASGAQLVGYSGFSASNYIEQPYNSALDFGTGDFCFMGWIKEAANSAAEAIAFRAAYNGAAWTGSGILLFVQADGTLRGQVSDDALATSDTITSTAVIDDNTWKLVALIRRSGYFELWINGAKAATDVAVTNANTSLSNTSATLRFGLSQNASSNPATNATLALWRASAYAPTTEQMQHIYVTEKAMSEAGSYCCLAGTSNAVTALAYDAETDLLHVGTSYGRSAFKGLARVAAEQTPVGSIIALAAGAGIIAQAGASGADVYVPAYTLREELNREAEQKAAFGAPLVFKDYGATNLQTSFALPVGYEPVAVYAVNGAGSATLQREGSGKQWTRTYDGFVWSVVFAAGRATSDWVSIGMRRIGNV